MGGKEVQDVMKKCEVGNGFSTPGVILRVILWGEPNIPPGRLGTMLFNNTSLPSIVPRSAFFATLYSMSLCVR